MKFTQEDPVYRQKLREVGAIPSILGLWQSHSNSGMQIRNKALKTLHMMAIDNTENKVGTVCKQLHCCVHRTRHFLLSPIDPSIQLLLSAATCMPLVKQTCPKP
jgi:hypothetical protein